MTPTLRRPTAAQPWGVVLSVLTLLTVAGCNSEAVAIDHGRRSASCTALIKALPDTVADELRRSVSPDDAPGAAWGDPAIVLSCGVDIPPAYDEFSACLEANGVGWFIPEDTAEHPGAEVVMTTIGYEPNVEVRVPATYRPSGPAAAMAELAEPIKAHLRLVKACY